MIMVELTLLDEALVAKEHFHFSVNLENTAPLSSALVFNF